jgi:hypothetical protein
VLLRFIVMYSIRVYLLSGNEVVMRFESEAHKENFIAYLFYFQKHLISRIVEE